MRVLKFTLLLYAEENFDKLLVHTMYCVSRKQLRAETKAMSLGVEAAMGSFRRTCNSIGLSQSSTMRIRQIGMPTSFGLVD